MFSIAPGQGGNWGGGSGGWEGGEDNTPPNIRSLWIWQLICLCGLYQVQLFSSTALTATLSKTYYYRADIGNWGLEAALSRLYEFVHTGEMLAVVACWPSMSLQSVAEQEMASLFLAAGPAASAHKQGWRGEGV